MAGHNLVQHRGSIALKVAHRGPMVAWLAWPQTAAAALCPCSPEFLQLAYRMECQGVEQQPANAAWLMQVEAAPLRPDGPAPSRYHGPDSALV